MKRRKLLIIDDEEDFGFLMNRYFTTKNFEVYIALTLLEGMRILEEVRPDVIFLDNNLPDGFGWDKTEYILINYPLTQLNLISAIHTLEKSTSSHRILEKPLHWEALKEICDSVAQKRIN